MDRHAARNNSMESRTARASSIRAIGGWAFVWAVLFSGTMAPSALAQVEARPPKTVPATPEAGKPPVARPDATATVAVPLEPVVPLPEAISEVATALAALGGPDAVCATEASQQASLLDGYVAHMLAAHLESRGMVVHRLDDSLSNADPEPVEVLPKPVLQELSADGAGLFVHAVTVIEAGQRYLVSAVYDANTGRRKARASKPFYLPQQLESLVSAERTRLDASDASWLELFDIMFQSSKVPGARDALGLAEAEYLFDADVWQSAARPFLEAAAGEPNRYFMRAIFALRFAGDARQAGALLGAAAKRYPDSGPIWALRGWLSLRQKRPDHAVLWLEQARLSDLGREGLYRYANGLLALELKNDDQAREEFARAADLLPDVLFPQFQLARFYRDRGELAKAINYYRRAARTPNPTAETWAELAVALEASGDPDEAITALRQAFRLQTDSLFISRHLAALLKKKGRYDEALDIVRRSAEANPRKPALLAAYGDAAAEMWALDVAQRAYEESVRADGDFPYGKVRLAALATARAQYREARAMLTDLLAVKPSYCPARVELGRLLGQLGHFREAIAVMKDATSSSDYEIDARLVLVELYLDANLPEEAVACAQIAASARPDGQSYAALADAFLAAGDKANAEIAAAAAVEKEPLSAVPHISVARVLQAGEKPEDALKEANRALELNPYSVEALELAGSLCQALGDFRKCSELWQRALALNPCRSELHRRLADVLGPKLGDWSGAHLHLTEYISLEEARAEAAR
jgi:tetratricopeptide (TPR) repeat protein